MKSDLPQRSQRYAKEFNFIKGFPLRYLASFAVKKVFKENSK